MKKIILLIMLLLCIGFVSAWNLQTIMNPYTGKLDYFGINSLTNFSGTNGPSLNGSNTFNSVYVITTIVNTSFNASTNMTLYNMSYNTVNGSNTFNGNLTINGNTVFGPSYILQYVNYTYNATSNITTTTYTNVTVNSSVGFNTTVTFYKTIYIVNATVSNNIIITAISTTPNISTTSGIMLFSEDRGEESLLGIMGKQGYDIYATDNPMYDDVCWYQPAHTTTGTTAPLAIGFTPTVPVGTVSNPAKTYGNFRDTMTWTTLTSAAGLNELKGSGLNYARGNSTLGVSNGGYKLVVVWNVLLADANTTGMVGMVDSFAPYTNVSNNVRGALSTNSIWAGFTQGALNTNLSYFSTNATAGALNKLYDCGANYPIGNITTGYTAVYETTIFAKSSGGNVSFYTKRLDTTAFAPCIFSIIGNSTFLPLSTIPQTFKVFEGRDNVNSSTTGLILQMNKIFIASDN